MVIVLIIIGILIILYLSRLIKIACTPWQKLKVEKVTNGTGKKVYYRVIWTKCGKFKDDLAFWNFEDAMWYFNFAEFPGVQEGYDYTSWAIYINGEKYIVRESDEPVIALIKDQVKEKSWDIETVYIKKNN